MTDYKQLCAELVNELHAYKIGNPSHDTDLIDRARAALAEPEPEGELTDQELLDLSVKCNLTYLWGEGEYYSPYMENHNIRDYVLSFARALRYIEKSHGRLYGVGWDRVYEKADHLKPSHGAPAPLDVQVSQS